MLESAGSSNWTTCSAAATPEAGAPFTELDVALPGADGTGLMRTLPALADLPVILVSAYGSGDLAIDPATRRVTVAGRAVRLTATEYKLLHALSLYGRRRHLLRVAQATGLGRPRRPPPRRPCATPSASSAARSETTPGTLTYIFSERGLGYRMPAPDDP